MALISLKTKDFLSFSWKPQLHKRFIKHIHIEKEQIIHFHKNARIITKLQTTIAKNEIDSLRQQTFNIIIFDKYDRFEIKSWRPLTSRMPAFSYI